MISSFSSVACIKKPVTVVAPVVDSNYGNVLIIGPGTNGLGRSSNFGNTWTFGSAPFSVNLNTRICYGNGLWVIVGNDAGTMKSAASSNGNTWTTSNSLNSTIYGNNSAYISGLAFGNGIFMTCGYNSVLSSSGTPVAISSDGLTWVNGGNIFGPSKITNAVVYGNGYWVAVANSGGFGGSNLYYSTNVSIANASSISWSSLATISEDPLYSVIYAENRWYIGARAGKTFYSELNPKLPPGLTPTFSQKPFTPTMAAVIPYSLSSVPGILAIGSWSPGAGQTARVFQIDSVGTTRFIAVGGGYFVSLLNASDPANNNIVQKSGTFSSTLVAMISIDGGLTWSNLTSVNTNMAAGCYGVAFAK
jgi:hypothetical protein